jgi:hypothetical protein
MNQWKRISDKIREASSEIVEAHEYIGSDMPEVTRSLLDAMHALLWAHTELLDHVSNATPCESSDKASTAQGDC